MSLLMEALRKAEEQKQKLAEETREAAKEKLQLEPLAASTDVVPAGEQKVKASRGDLPELPTRLEDLDEQFMAARAPAKDEPQPRAEPPAQPRVEDTHAARESARNLFAAKQPTSGSGDNRSFSIVAGVLGLVGALGIGGYFWWQLQPRGGLGAVPASVVSVPAAPIAVAPVLPAVSPAPTFGGTLAAAGKQDDEEIEEPPVAPPSRVAPRPFPPVARVREESPIRLTTSVLKTDTVLEQAWQAFNTGEFELARVAWEKTLAADPRNAAALHGLAALAQRRGQPDVAAEYYLRALEADPRDPLALAGLTTLQAPVDALRTESRLKTLLAEQPDSPHLNFALGNLYAYEARWADAQQAYFRAHAADAANPDYLFNLAVSLDQLRQPRLAAEYYERALTAAARLPAGFDAAQAATRLKALQATR